MAGKIKQLYDNQYVRIGGFVALFSVIAAVALVATRAAGPSAWLESENSTVVTAPAATVTGDSTASNNGYIKFGVAPASTNQPPALVTGGATWTNIFNDDFDGNTINEFSTINGQPKAAWNVLNNSNYGTGNNEDQCYKAANVTVSGGTVKLIGKRETVTGCGSNPDGGSSYFFTSGMLSTSTNGGSLKFKYKQGYTEARVRMPRGNLYWPAYWLVGAGDGSSPGWPAYGEFDIFEEYGSKPDRVESNYHRTGGNIGAANHCVNGSSSCGLSINPPNALVAGGANNWHTYGFNWTANKIEWYIDGVRVRTYNASTQHELDTFNYEHSIFINLAIGGNGPRYSDHGYTGNEFTAASSSGGGCASPVNGYCNGNLQADLPGTYEIDYVKVWQAP